MEKLFIELQALDLWLTFLFCTVYYALFLLFGTFAHKIFADILMIQEKDARDIEIPNIKWDIFELMMRLF